MEQGISAESIDRLRRSGAIQGGRFYEQIGSTNDAALQLARQSDLPMPHLVLAQRQSAGRGRGSNQWWSAPGGLTFSLILTADWQARAGQMSLLVGLAVCEAIERLMPGEFAALKWPNDVYLRQRKVCGILVEAPSTQPPRLVVGIGLNVNQSFETAPAELRSKATSLAEVGQRQFELEPVLAETLRQLNAILSRLADPSFDLPATWQRRCLLTGCQVEIETPRGIEIGICRGIDAQGALEVEDSQGRRQSFFAGVVKWFGAG